LRTVVNDRPLKMQWSIFWGLKAQISGLNFFFVFIAALRHVFWAISCRYRHTGLFTVVWKPSYWKCIVGAKRGKIRKGVIGFSPKQTWSYSLGPVSLCKISSKSNQNCGCRSVYRRTDRMTFCDFMICPMQCYSNGTVHKLIEVQYNAIVIFLSVLDSLLCLPFATATIMVLSHQYCKINYNIIGLTSDNSFFRKCPPAKQLIYSSNSYCECVEVLGLHCCRTSTRNGCLTRAASPMTDLSANGWCHQWWKWTTSLRTARGRTLCLPSLIRCSAHFKDCQSCK